MAVYRIGDILRMKREALGITREKLCEMSGEICSPQTLYRMECGKVKVKQSIYRELMKCMGELPERRYASIKVSKYQALNLKKEIHFYLVQREYEKAEKKLEKLEQFMDDRYVRNKQYVLEVKSIIAYSRQEISEEEYLERLWKALRYTVPKLEKIELNRWPYNRMEFEILMDILSAYYNMGDKERKKELAVKLKENAERKYMEEDYYVVWHMQILVWLTQIMSMEKQHEQAIEHCNIGIKEVKNQRILGTVYDLLYDLVWNTEQLVQKGILKEKERALCKKLLVQAYYLNIAQMGNGELERIKRLCNQFYPDEIKSML